MGKRGSGFCDRSTPSSNLILPICLRMFIHSRIVTAKSRKNDPMATQPGRTSSGAGHLVERLEADDQQLLGGLQE